MEMVVEHACEKCGGPLLKPATTALGLATPATFANKCDRCGHVTDALRMARFQWTPHLRSMVDRLCSDDEGLHLRRDPVAFVSTTLNAKLRASGKAEFLIHTSSTPLTLRQKGDSE